MKAAFLKKMGEVQIRDVAIRGPGDDEIRVKVDACGVCGTDVTSALDGKEEYQGFGHEIAGTVLELGPGVRNVSVGQKVVLESGSACGRCANCRNCRQELCTDVQSFWFTQYFGFAEEMITPAVTAIPYEGVSPQEACLSEPAGVAVDMHRLADIRIGDHVVVSGLGPIGLMALRLAKLSGAEKIYGCARSHSTARIELARRFGADEIIEIDKTPVEEYRFERAPDRFMVSSPPRTLPAMIKVAAKGAVISYIGIEYGKGADITFDANEFHFKKIQLRASYASPAMYTPMALNHIVSGRIDAAALISHTFPLAQIGKGLEVAAYDKAGAVKVIINPNA